jgi:hypothetical protein
MFPGQGSDSDKVFVFKMSEVGPGSGVHLVNRMQPGGDLEHAWIMFDHVKRVKNWTTMACHVYDSAYCRVMTIAVCDMQSEDAAAQMVLWKNLNDVMVRHGVPEPKFKGFMADSAKENWNAVRVIYGSGDASIPMKDQERTCLDSSGLPLHLVRSEAGVPFRMWVVLDRSRMPPLLLPPVVHKISPLPDLRNGPVLV